MASTIQDVADKAHVSVSTVSRAFSRPDLVSEKTRRKVLAIAEELNFAVSRSATVFQSGRSFRIALLLSASVTLWFNAQLYDGLNSVFHDEGYDISIYPIGQASERAAFFSSMPVRRYADAVIVPSFDIRMGIHGRLSRHQHGDTTPRIARTSAYNLCKPPVGHNAIVFGKFPTTGIR